MVIKNSYTPEEFEKIIRELFRSADEQIMKVVSVFEKESEDGGR